MQLKCIEYHLELGKPQNIKKIQNCSEVIYSERTCSERTCSERICSEKSLGVCYTYYMHLLL
jgi:hypothetical protein